MSFQSLGLSAELLRGPRPSGGRKPAPERAQTHPLIVEGRGVPARAMQKSGALERTQEFAAYTNADNETDGRIVIWPPTRPASTNHGKTRTFYEYLRW